MDGRLDCGAMLLPTTSAPPTAACARSAGAAGRRGWRRGVERDRGAAAGAGAAQLDLLHRIGLFRAEVLHPGQRRGDLPKQRLRARAPCVHVCVSACAPCVLACVHVCMSARASCVLACVHVRLDVRSAG
eukprot:363725-Chlamydomonas_euryale.AAC.6